MLKFEDLEIVYYPNIESSEEERFSLKLTYLNDDTFDSIRLQSIVEATAREFELEIHNKDFPFVGLSLVEIEAILTEVEKRIDDKVKLDEKRDCIESVFYNKLVYIGD